MKSDKNKVSVHIQTKVSESDYEPFKRIISETGIKPAKLFRDLILSNGENLVVEGKDSTHNKDINRMIFYFNKTSNNMNQIAKRLNECRRTGVISERVFLESLNKLISIESYLISGLENAN